MQLSGPINRGLARIPPPLIYGLAFAYAAWMLWLGVTNQLGADPVKVLEHAMGEAALYMLVAGLAVTPLRQVTKVNLLKFRRAIGVTCFFFVVLHLVVWAVLDVQRLGAVWADIVKRPYITVGMAGFALLLPLALTSNNWSIKTLGAVAWRKLHTLVYPAAILGGVHYLMQAKGFQLKPVFFLFVILALVAWRFLGLRVSGSARREKREAA
ncbi:MAG: protein-methionine-sulfoxide reductase heme-binding subunit MsrQ [Pseudomonadota bacterium]